MTHYESISDIAKFLETAFDKLNERFFDNELPRPMVTIQSTPKAYGHFTMYDAWVGDEGKKEINLGAETLNRPIDNVIATLVHEMVHYYCFIRGIKDTSNAGRYHNKRFKAEAESRGLSISYAERIGWSVTEPDEVLKGFVHSNGWSNITFARNTPTKAAGKKKNPLRKYICPCCEAFVYATKPVTIRCEECDQLMEWNG